MNQIKHLLTIACLLIGTTFMYAQSDCDKNSAYICDDFESYDETMPLGPQSTDWTTWSGNEGGAEDGSLSTDFANSGTKSLKVEGGGTQDMILQLGNQTSGRYRVRFSIYMPAGMGGYYNIQHDFDGPAAVFEWASQIQFFPDGIAQLDAGAGGDAVFYYEQDTWLQVDQIVDMDADTSSIAVGGKHLHSWKFSLQATQDPAVPGPNPGTNQLSAINFYPIDATHEFYIDDVFVEALPDCSLDAGAIICDDMDAYDATMAIGPQSSFWTTWSINDGSAEDAMVSTNFAASGTQSMLIGNDGAQDVVLQLGNRISGKYTFQFMTYIPAGADGYFNLHSEEVYVANQSDWLGEFYLGYDGTNDTEGMGAVNLDGTTFAFPHDAWFMIRCDVDIDNNLLDFWVDGVQVYTDYPTADLGLGMVDFFSASDAMEMYIDNVLFKVTANDCSSASLGESTGPNAVCFGDPFSFDVGPSVIPQVNDFGNLSGFEWGIFTADVTGSTDPFNDPAYAGLWLGAFPSETFAAEGVNDGSIFPPGVFYMAPIYFGNAINTDGYITGLDFSDGCIVTGTAIEVTFLAELEDIVANETITNTTGGNDNGSILLEPTGGAAVYTYAWDNGATTAEVTDLAPGPYTVTITSSDDLGCSNEVVETFEIQGSSAVEDIEKLESLTVAPNPTRGQIVVDMQLNATATIQMDITDITGKVVAQINPQNTSSYQQTVDLSHLANGLYFARIIVDGESAVKKIILSK